MKKWQYCYISKEYTYQLQEEANQLGRAGWELVNATHSEYAEGGAFGRTHSSVTYHFKREIS